MIKEEFSLTSAGGQRAELSLTSAGGGDGDVGPDFNRVLVLGPASLDQVFPVAAWWIMGLTVSALVVLFVLRWFYVVTESTKKLEEEYVYLIPRESSDKLQLRLQEAERDLKRAQEVLRKHPATQSRNDYFLVLEEVNWLKNQLDEKEEEREMEEIFSTERESPEQ